MRLLGSLIEGGVVRVTWNIWHVRGHLKVSLYFKLPFTISYQKYFNKIITHNGIDSEVLVKNVNHKISKWCIWIWLRNFFHYCICTWIKFRKRLKSKNFNDVSNLWSPWRIWMARSPPPYSIRKLSQKSQITENNRASFWERIYGVSILLSSTNCVGIFFSSRINLTPFVWGCMLRWEFMGKTARNHDFDESEKDAIYIYFVDYFSYTKAIWMLIDDACWIWFCSCRLKFSLSV